MERWGRKPLPAKRKAPSTQISTGPIRRERHRYLAAATASADALLGEITFCYELVDDGNNFFRNKEEYERTFQTWTTLANNALSRLRGVMDSDKRRWNGYMRDRKAKTP